MRNAGQEDIQLDQDGHMTILSVRHFAVAAAAMTQFDLTFLLKENESHPNRIETDLVVAGEIAHGIQTLAGFQRP
jgi:hypothetical protein